MFTLTQIAEAHSKVKSGADFPAYVQDLIALGVISYSTFVTDGHTVYSGKNGYTISSPAKYPALEIATEKNSDAFRHSLKIHQHGQTNYPTFCKHSAEAGVEKWIVDTNALTCTYYDLNDTEMLNEKIPAVAK